MYVLGYSGFTRDSRAEDGYRNPFAKTRQDFDSIFAFHEGEVPFQMFPLGFFGHDASAALLCDGELVACASEERFCRSKHALNLAGNTLLPRNAIRYCLDEAGIGIDDVDTVAHYCSFDEAAVQERHALLLPWLTPEEDVRVASSYREVHSQMMDRPVLLRQFEAMTGSLPRRFVQVDHHLAHAASAYYPSGFDKALVFTIDGTGERESAMIAVGRGDAITPLSRTPLPTSLGTLYLIVTVFLGFRSLGDEYKVMGLAGYGDPQCYRNVFRSLVRMEENGEYTLRDFARSDLQQRLIAGLGLPRRRGEEITQRHYDIAAALQECLQQCVLHTLRHAQRETGLQRLCMAGGVALNSMMNGVIARSELFEDIFIQPAAGDDGGGLGAALHAWYQHPDAVHPRRSGRTRSVFAGPEYDESAMLNALQEHADELQWGRPSGIVEATAQALASGSVVGWFQGRMEYGPRALGNRSILADPRPADMKDRINEKVKHRESFRPFAPAVPVEDAGKYFDMHGLQDSPFMLFVVPVHTAQREMIPAVTHVDGTARVQTVAQDANPLFWELLRAFERRTGLPVLLNTSFNVMHEPIVCSPSDAVRCFLHTDIDLLILGPWYVTKRMSEESR